jgi:exonuclease III
LSKIVAITSCRANVILLSDLCLGTNLNQIEKIRKMFLTNSSKSYNFMYNSDKNSRGVGILIDSSLNYSITDSYEDPNQNILGLNITLDGIHFFLASIYGPNDNDKSFFINLYDILISNLDRPVIVGGDWNTTYSTSDSSSNIDILHMQKPPSLLRSGWLNEICLGADMIDPYRAFYPSRRDYTFVPHGTKKNRSRLDFFLISSDILQFSKDALSLTRSHHLSLTINWYR